MIQNKETLEQNVCKAREELNKAEEKIAAHQDTLELISDKPVKILNCKNIFNKVKVGAGLTEDVRFIVNCECFDEHDVCCNRKCNHLSDNLNYISACDKLLVAKKALADFKQSEKVELVK